MIGASPGKSRELVQWMRAGQPNATLASRQRRAIPNIDAPCLGQLIAARDKYHAVYR